MSSENNLETPEFKPSNVRKSLAREPIGKKLNNKMDKDSKKTETKNLYPDIPDSKYETENEPDATEENYNTESSEKSTKNSCCEYPFSLYIAAIVLLLGSMFTCFNYFSGGKTEVADNKSATDVADLIIDMKTLFKNQPDLTYGILKSQLKKVVDKTIEPSAPAIITLIANKGAEITASEFSQHLVRRLAPETHLLINDSKYWYDEPDNIILKIDNEIRTYAQVGNLSIVVVDKVEKIPADAAMIFHSFCDHEAAPYKRAIFLFIVPANKNIPVEANIKEIDQIAMDRLRNIWKEATDDKIDSLITRLTVSVVSVR